MSVAIITGSAGLVGSEAVAYFAARGLDVVGIDNDMRAEFFGKEASTRWVRDRLRADVMHYRHHEADIRDTQAIEGIFARYGNDISLVIHAAAQPSHDWAASRTHDGLHCECERDIRNARSDAAFCAGGGLHFHVDEQGLRRPSEPACRWWRWRRDGKSRPVTRMRRGNSGNDVDRRNDAQLVWSIEGCRRRSGAGIRALLRHEDGVFSRRLSHRPQSLRHAAPRVPGLPDEMRGHRTRLTRSSATSGSRSATTFTAADLVAPSNKSSSNPRSGEVYNIGGGRQSNCSMLEAIALCEEITGNELRTGTTWRRIVAETTSGGSAMFQSSKNIIRTGGSNTTSRRFCAKSMN